MQGIRFGRLLHHIQDRLRIDDLVSLLFPLVGGQNQNFGLDNAIKDRFSHLIFAARDALHDLSQSPETAELVSDLGIAEFLSPQALGKVVAAFHSVPDSNHLRARQEFWLFRNLVANLQAFQRLTAAVSKRLVEPKELTDQSMAIVEVVLYGEENVPIPLAHLIKAVEAVQHLHDTIARIDKVSATALISYLESGTDFLFGVLTKSKIASDLASTLREWWAKHKYRELADLDRRLDTLGKGLTIIDRLDQVSARGGIEAEEARRLKHDLLQDLKRVTGLGMKVSESKEEDQVRALVAQKRDVRLLSAGSGQPESGSAAPDEEEPHANAP